MPAFCPACGGRLVRLLGTAAGRADAPDPARGHYAQAIALSEELGMRPLAARSHPGLGRLLRRAGLAASAETHLAAARELFREMGMTFWIERTEGGEVGPLGGPSDF